MTIEEAKEVIEQDIPCEYDSDLIDALNMAIKSLEEWKEVKADIDNLLYVDSLIFGELMDFAEGKISADDVIEEFNRVAKAEIKKIISEHLQEVEE